MNSQTSIPEKQWGVHETHCCKKHGCKYGKDDCPVELGLIKQEGHCEDGYYNRDCFEKEITWDSIIKDSGFMSEYVDRLHLLNWLKQHYNAPTKK